MLSHCVGWKRFQQYWLETGKELVSDYKTVITEPLVAECPLLCSNNKHDVDVFVI